MRCSMCMASTYTGSRQEIKTYKHASSGLRKHATDSILLVSNNGIRPIGIHIVLFLDFVHCTIFIEIRRFGSRTGFRNVVFL